MNSRRLVFNMFSFLARKNIFHLSWKQKLIVIIVVTLIGLLTVSGSGFLGFMSIGDSFNEQKKVAEYNANALVLANKLLALKLSSAELTTDSVEKFSTDLDEINQLGLMMQLDAERINNIKLNYFSEKIAKLVSVYVDGNKAVSEGRKVIGYNSQEGELKLISDVLEGLESISFTMIEESVVNISSGQKSYLITKNEKDKIKIENALKILEDLVGEMSWGENKIGSAVKVYRETFDRVITLIDSEYLMLDDLQIILDELNVLLQEQKTFLDEIVLDRVSKEVDAVQTAAIKIMFFSSIVIGLIILASLVAISRELNVQLKYMHKFLNKMSTGDFSQQLEVNDNQKDEFTQLKVVANLMVKDISYVMSQVIEGNDDLVAIREQLDDAVVLLAEASEAVESKAQKSKKSTKLISNAVNDVAERSSHVNKTAQSASESTRIGNRVVNDSVGSMSSIVELISSTHKEVENLSTSSAKMVGIIDVINGLADQTNLLALNAAIESARAGEAGRGFSVVADEVRALAQKTVSATANVGDIIKDFNAQSRSMSDLMTKGIKLASSGQDNANNAQGSFSSIEDSIQQVAAEMNQVVSAVEGIASNSNDIAVQVGDIFEHAESTSKARLTLEEHSRKLCSQTKTLKDITQRFKLLNEE